MEGKVQRAQVCSDTCRAKKFYRRSAAEDRQLGATSEAFRTALVAKDELIATLRAQIEETRHAAPTVFPPAGAVTPNGRHVVLYVERTDLEDGLPAALHSVAQAPQVRRLDRAVQAARRAVQH